MEDNENIQDKESHQETNEDAMFDTDETTTTLESDEENKNKNESIEDEPEQEQNEINRETQTNETRNDLNKERNGTVVQDIEEADPRITGVLQGNEQEDIPLANFDTQYPEEEVTFDQDKTSNKIEVI